MTTKLPPFLAACLVCSLGGCSGGLPDLTDGGLDSGLSDSGLSDAGDGGPQAPDGGPLFGTPLITSLDGGVARLAAGDFNGDGKSDLIVALGGPEAENGLLAFLAGNGDGTFAPPTLLWAGVSPKGVAALDLDGDGRPDVAVGVCGDGGNRLSTFLAIEGGFGPRQDVAVSSCPSALAVADLDHDGRPDLVAASTSAQGNGALFVFLSRDGGLQLAQTLETAGAATAITTADLDGDGFADLAAATSVFDGGRPVASTLLVWLSLDGGAAWDARPALGLENGPYTDAIAADLDRDGIPDLVLVSAFTDTLALVLGKGDGSFQKPGYLDVSGEPIVVGAADFRQAGWLDVVMAVAGTFPFVGLSVFAGGPPDPLPLAPEQGVLTDGEAFGLTIADFNGDGWPDIALSLPELGCIAVVPSLGRPPTLDDPTTFKPAPHARLGRLNYLGGPTLASPQVVTITFTNDPDAQVYEGFDDWIVGSDWLATVGKDYGVGLGTNVNVMLDQAAPSNFTDMQIQTFLVELILDGGVPPITVDDGGTAEQIYFLYLPDGTTVESASGTSCQNYLAYHGEDDLGPVPFAYAVIPRCYPSVPYSQENSASHELAEASSDPLITTGPAYTNSYGNGWVGEAGDLCTLYQTGYQMPDGGPYYAVQRIWSITAAAASVQPCIPAPGTLYANVSPRSGPGVQEMDESLFSANAGDTFAITLTGWSSAPAVPFGLLVIPQGVGLVPASFYLDVSIDRFTLGNGDTATLTLTVPANAGHQTYGAATIFTGWDDGNYGYWPIAVFVP